MSRRAKPDAGRGWRGGDHHATPDLHHGLLVGGQRQRPIAASRALPHAITMDIHESNTCVGSMV
jgi:hypothetical protein